jgi:hypothetical protein
VHEIQVWIDTGFNGDLVLPQQQIDALGLPKSGTVKAILADGSEVGFRVGVETVAPPITSPARPGLRIGKTCGPLAKCIAAAARRTADKLDRRLIYDLDRMVAMRAANVHETSMRNRRRRIAQTRNRITDRAARF